MNPLSPLTYYRRHKRQTFLLMGLIALMTLGVCTMVRLLGSLPEGVYAARNYLTRVSLISAAGPSLDPSVVSQIRTHPGVARVIQEKGLELEAPYIFGEHHLFGVTETDMQVLMETCDLGLKAGRLPQPRTNEMALTEEVANTMGLQIGDQIDRSIGEDWAGDNYYAAIPAPLELVGILQSQGPEPHIRLGFVSYEYVNSHELFVSPWSPGLVVIARNGRAIEVESFLEGEIASPSTQVMTHRQLSDRYEGFLVMLHVIFGVVDVLVAIVMALVIAAINQIAQTKRLEEFGLLNALGHSKKRLLRRLTLEMAITTGLGWLVGLTLSWMLFALLRESVFQPRGIPLGLATLTPIWFSLPIPLITIAFVAWATRRTFARFDAVAIVERGKLSMEATGQQKAKHPQARRASTKPLSSLTFYLRHRRRALILIATMGLMILSVSFPAFLLAPVADAMKPFAEPLRTVGIVTPRAGTAVDPGVTAQIRAHPTVAHVVPAMELPLRVLIPPLGWVANFYGVPQGDMQPLVERLGMQVKEGRLPQPRTNEVLLSEALVQNRGWRVGDRIGAPVDEQDHGIPTELVIVGILAPAGEGQKDPWLGLASYEYLSSHERYASYPVHLLTVPVEGQKAAMDAWLREEVHSDLVEVYTYQWMLKNFRLMGVLLLGVFGVVESIIAIVAAVALGALSYVFFVQRREEFGILHAIGRSRPWLVMRTARETMSTVGLAWLLSAIVCGLGLAYVQAAVYAPRGLEMNILNPAPWLFTLPLPLAVVAVSSGLVSRMLRKLDPVSVVERRS
jgi:ABC-type lipoprotein release transport system permease subunit